jgi:hypothetical protein
MLGDAVRYYPVLKRTGDLGFVCFREDRWWDIQLHSMANPYFSETFLRDKKPAHQDANGYVFYDMDPVYRKYLYPDCRFYRVGIDAVPDGYQGKIRGLPMLYPLPFEFLKSYSLGSALG